MQSDFVAWEEPTAVRSWLYLTDEQIAATAVIPKEESHADD
jgi:hypothetical protein